MATNTERRNRVPRLIPYAMAALILLSAWRWPILGVYAIPLRGVAPLCSRSAAVQNAFSETKRRYDEIVKNVAAKSRVVETEGSMKRIVEPGGQSWWTPGEINLHAVLRAQQDTDIYGAIHPGEVVIDCGAHVGVFTRRALDQGAALVIAVEPAPSAAACFRRNLAAELAKGSVRLVEKAIWDGPGELKFNLNGNGDAADSAIVRFTDAKQVTVETIAIDALVREHGLDRVDLIKADVKGATGRMISGSAGTIRRFHPRLALSTEEPPEDPGDLMNRVKAIDGSYGPTCGVCFLTEREIRLSVLFLDVNGGRSFQPRSK